MIKVLHKALNILEYLSRYPDGQTLSAIAAHIGEKSTTVSNIVQVLAKRNYLERCERGWKLGVSAYMLTGSAADYDRALCVVAEPVLRELAAQTEAAVVLSVWRGNGRYILLRIADKSSVTVNRSYPEVKEIYHTATGMLLLAEQPDEIITAHIDENGLPDNSPISPTAVEVFRARLNLYREKGYYIREKQSIFEAAAPIYDPDGQVRTAVGIFLPLFRATEKDKLIASLLHATEELSRRLRDNAEKQV